MLSTYRNNCQYELHDQDETLKIRIRRRRVEDNEDSPDIDTINIRIYFDPTTYRMLLNPQEHDLRSEKLVIVIWDISGFVTSCNRLNELPFIIMDLLKNFFSDSERIIRKNKE